MPVARLQGALHARDRVEDRSACASRLTKRQPTGPRRTVGGRPRAAASAEVALAVDEAADRHAARRRGRGRRAAGAGRAGRRGAPPWLPFSRRCPCVTSPGTSTSVANGSGARAARRERDRHDPHRLVPRGPRGVVGRRRPTARRPCLTPTRQFGRRRRSSRRPTTPRPAGSKYFARERKSRTVRPSRVSFRSVHRPPGCRWPAVPTSTPSSVDRPAGCGASASPRAGSSRVA